MADENPETTDAPAEPQDEAPAEETQKAQAETESEAPAETKSEAPAETQEEAPQTEEGEAPVESQEEAQIQEAQIPEPQVEGEENMVAKSVKPSILKMPKVGDDEVPKGSKVVLKESTTSLTQDSRKSSRTTARSSELVGAGSKSSVKKMVSIPEMKRTSSMLVTPDAEEAQEELIKSGIVKRELSQALAMPKYAKVDRRSRLGSLRSSIALAAKQGGGDAERVRAPKYMNTYHLESKNPFKCTVVKRLLIEIIDKEFEGVKYDPLNCAKMCLTVTNDLRAKVKQLGYERYKIVCTLQIGEKKYQSVQSILGFLWDADRDNYATYTFENAHLYAIACVYGIYYE